jgi:hypothetical protein
LGFGKSEGSTPGPSNILMVYKVLETVSIDNRTFGSLSRIAVLEGHLEITTQLILTEECLINVYEIASAGASAYGNHAVIFVTTLNQLYEGGISLNCQLIL